MNINKKEFVEKFKVDKVKFLYNLSYKEYNELFNSLRKNKKKYTAEEKKTYFNQVRQFLNFMITEENIEDGYYLVDNNYYKSSGRLYARNWGIQKLQREVRDFLLDNNTNEIINYDIDIVNCVPSLIYYLAKKNDIKCKTLKSYVKDRKEILASYGLDKNQVLIEINKDKKTTKNEWLALLWNDIDKIRDVINNQEIYDKIEPDEDSKNPKASKFSKILYDIETEIIEKAININDGVSALIFDGFISTNNNIDEINKVIQEEYKNINFCCKPFTPLEKVIIKYQDYLTNGASSNHYKDKKIILENNFSYVTEQGIYIEKVNGKWYERTLEQFKMNCATIRHKDTDGKLTDTFSTWKTDPERKVYSRIEFRPYNIYNDEEVKKNTSDETIINTFDGFDSVKLPDEELETEEAKEIITTFLEFIDEVITNNDEELRNHIINFMAHLVQYPNQLVEIIHVFKSLEGAGKDTFIEIISNMLGERYVYSTEDQNEIFGNYNEVAEGKLILVFNEASGTDSNKNKEKIKGLSTAKKMNIKKKYANTKTVDSFLRIFFFSNSNKPVRTEADSRRFCIIRNGWKKIGDTEYFSRMRKVIFNKHAMNVIFSFLVNCDIKGYSPRWNKPITEEEVKMKVDNYCMLKYWLYLNLDNLKKNQYFYKKENGKYLITPSNFQNLFLLYLKDEHYDKKTIKEWNNYKRLKSVLTTSMTGVISKRATKARYWEIDFDIVEDYLSKVFRNHKKDKTGEIDMTQEEEDDFLNYMNKLPKFDINDLDSDDDY
jgi:hypothetical protein|tara:strand:+ start:4319 stop:6637 length:2319 start_codon:yes stop_codon:yes gene_type:complete